MGHELARRKLLAMAAVLPFTPAMSAVAAGSPRDGELIERLVVAAAGWLDGLAPRLRERARLPFDDGARSDWHYIPRRRPGVALNEQDEVSRSRLFEILDRLLSADGIERVHDIIMLEHILGELTGNPHIRDPGNYTLGLFGQPSTRRPWAMRFEGHHLSLSFTIVPGRGIAVTPHFVGANPAIVPAGHEHAGFELLARERRLAFDLVRGLESEERRRVSIDEAMARDIVTGPGREQSLKQPSGLALHAMNEAQREVVMAIVASFAGSLRPELAERQLADIREAGIDDIHFAFAGTPEPGTEHYFRIHGPGLIIEYDDTRGGNHVHAVWHDPADVFGRDLLRRHYEAADHG